MRAMSDVVRIPASVFPTDLHGFLSRECPSCDGRFKVEVDPHGAGAEDSDVSDEEAVDEAESMQRYCPLCHELVEGNQWWTVEQIDYAKDAISAAVVTNFQDMLEDTARQSDGGLTFRRGDIARVPLPPAEIETMIIVVPPCHEDDRLKVPDEWTGDVACHRCGIRYPVDLIRL
jgi:hypothetical protein